MSALSDTDAQWARILADGDLEIRRIAYRVVREPSIRRLFPYVSMHNLRFRSAAPPFAEHPYILTESEGERYQLRDMFNTPLAQGGLDEVVDSFTRVLALGDSVPETDPLAGMVIVAIVRRVEGFGLVAESVGEGGVDVFVDVACNAESDLDRRDRYHIGQEIRVKLERRTVLGQYVGTVVDP